MIKNIKIENPIENFVSPLEFGTEIKKMSKERLLQFLLKSRTQTYAGGKGKVKPILDGSVQLEYKEGTWLYRDIYYTGNSIFTGLETVYFQGKPVWAMSYYGNFKGLAEEEIDKILREALIKNWQEARTWKKVEWVKNDYRYICEPDFGGGSIEELAGSEKIFKKGKQVYSFFYAGGIIA